MQKILVTLIGLSLLSCLNPDENRIDKTKVYHPTMENFNFSKVEELSESTQKNNGLQDLSERFKHAKLIYEIDEELILGYIRDVDIDESGNIYLLDADQLYVFQIDRKTRTIDTLSKKGRGPGEVLFPSAIEVKNQSLYISDEGVGIMSIDLNDRVNKDILFSDIYTKDFSVTDEGIFIKRRIVLPNTKNKINTIEYFDKTEKKITKQFGDAYMHSHKYAVDTYTTGFIEFIPETEVLIEVNQYQPLITGYKHGNLSWRRKITDFQQLEIWTSDSGYRLHEKHTHQQENKRQTYKELTTIENINGVFVFQIATKKWPNINIAENKKLETFLVDSETGASMQIDDMPKIMAIKNNKYVTLEETKGSLYKYYQF